MKRLATVGVAAVAAAMIGPWTARAQMPKVEGYDGYTFGMTVEQARHVKPAVPYDACDFKDVVGCIKYPVTISAFPAVVAVQFKGSPAKVVQIVVQFDSLRQPRAGKCKVVTAEVGRLLAAKYGPRPIVSRATATWTSPAGGSVSLTALCVDDDIGINAVAYQPSSTL